jgi:hypothetical protein
VYEGPNVENEAESLAEERPGGHLCPKFACLREAKLTNAVTGPVLIPCGGSFGALDLVAGSAGGASHLPTRVLPSSSIDRARQYRARSGLRTKRS